MVRQQSALPFNGLSQGQPDHVLHVLYWNADGLTSAKFIELTKIVIDNAVDVFGIVEAGAASDNPDDYKIPGYQTFTLPRARLHSSGIIVAAREGLCVDFKVIKEMNNLDRLEVVELVVWTGKQHHRLLFAYNPPRNKPGLDYLEVLWCNKSLLHGDMNAPSTRWGYRDTDNVGRLWENFLDSNPATCTNALSDPTFLAYSGSTSHPDLVIAHSSLASLVSSELLSAPSGFGHRVILTKISRKQNERFNPIYQKARWNLKKADWVRFTALSEEVITMNLISDKVDESCKLIQSGILKVAHETIPKGIVKNYRPFWNEKLQELKESRDAARDAFEMNGTPDAKVDLKRKTACLKRGVIEAKKRSVSAFLQELDFRKDGLKAHKYISNLNNQRSNPSVPWRVRNKLLTNNKDISKHLCKHFSQISNYKVKTADSYSRQRITCLTEEQDQLFNSPFEESELIFALQNTSKGKSSGPDDILPEFLLNLGQSAKSVILRLLNLVWEKHYPCDWRKAEIVPILKKGKPADQASSYRPISLTSMLSKVYERMILRRLEAYIENCEILSKDQSGFRRNRGTMEQVAQLSQCIKDGYQRQQSTLAVMIDYRTAFDRVWRGKLLEKMSEKGIAGRLFQAIRSYLSQRFIRVNYQGSVSPYRQMQQGLPQGSVLSPILFNIMIDDITDAVNTVPGARALLYADDLVVWATSSRIPALNECLNQLLKLIDEWSTNNKMEINMTKTVCQLFTLSTRAHDVSLKIGSNEITRVDYATYLGVDLDNRLNWSKHISRMCNQGEKRMSLLKRLAGTRWGASQDVLSTAYKTYVRPSMEYGSELLITASETTFAKLSITQNKALRLITGAPKSTPIAAMEVQSGIEPLTFRRDAAAVRFYERLKRGHSDYWQSYLPAKERLSSQHTFSSRVHGLALYGVMDETQRQPFPFVNDMVPRRLARGSLTLTEPVDKQMTPSAVLKAVFMETLHLWYPTDSWLHVYTDGSAQNANTNAGAGVYCIHFEFSEPVGKIASNFEGEIFAVKLALQQLIIRDDPRVVIFVDSQSAIQALTQNCPTDATTVLECRALVEKLLIRGSLLVLQWVPSHCQVEGNEKADELAKRGSNMSQPQLPLPYSSARRLISQKKKQLIGEEHERVAEGKHWVSLLNQQIPRDLPRKQSVACFRMQTGHDFLAKHLHRIGVYDSPICTLCNQEDMTATHLDSCSALQDIRNQVKDVDTIWCRKSILYWAARERMATEPSTWRN